MKVFSVLLRIWIFFLFLLPTSSLSLIMKEREGVSFDDSGCTINKERINPAERIRGVTKRSWNFTDRTVGSWFTAKKKQALIQKRDIVQNQLTLKEEKLLHFSTASLRCLADQCQLLNDKHHSTTSKILVEILNFAVRTELYLTAWTELDNALNECFVEQINVRDQAAITNKTINLSPVLPLLPGFLDHDARYRNQLHEFNQKSLLSQPLRLRRLDFTRLSAMDKQSELRFFGKQCQPLKAELQTILRKLEDQAICLISELTGPRTEN